MNMFKCQECKKSSRSGEKLNKFITMTRNKTYTNIKSYKSKRDNEIKTSERITDGSEIVKEKNLCGNCFELKTKKKHYKK